MSCLKKSNKIITISILKPIPNGLEKIFGKQLLINSTPLVSEIFLCARYLEKCNYEMDWSLESWCKAL